MGIAAKFQGADIVILFDKWEILSSANMIPILVAGNTVNLFLAYLGVVLFFKSERFKDLAFSNVIFRAGASAIGFAGAAPVDEFHIAVVLSMNPKVIYAFFFLMFLPPLLFICQALGKGLKQKFLKFGVLFGLFGSAMAFIVSMGELAKLYQDFFLFSLIEGLPLVMILLDASILGLLVFFVIRRFQVKARFGM